MPAVRGKEIRARRQRTGMKLRQFSEHAGIGYKTLANIESGGQKAVSIEVVYLIARALPDTTADDLLAAPGDEETAEPEAAAA